MNLALLGLHKSCQSFQDAVNGRDKLPNWERLWSDLVQKEIRRNTRDGVLVRIDDEENFAFAGKGKKAKGKKAQGKIESNQNGGKEKRDLSKIKCFHCYEFRHYATKSPNNKSNKYIAAPIAAREALTS